MIPYQQETPIPYQISIAFVRFAVFAASILFDEPHKMSKLSQ
jgi:hypothetical protein